mgnify:CR=1 FL=1
MKIISILLILGTVLMGLYDGGDITGALVIAVVILPGVFGKEKNKDVLQCMPGVRCSTGPGRKM